MHILCSGGLALRKHRSVLRGLVAPFYFFVFRFSSFLSSAFFKSNHARAAQGIKSYHVKNSPTCHIFCVCQFFK